MINNILHEIYENREKLERAAVYSGIDDLPSGYASDKVTKGCLVLEGGAFRAIYSEGVIDYLLQQGINFECVIGVSAGAMNGYNYVSGQIGRSARVNLRYRHDRNYVGLRPLVTDKGVIGFDYIFGDLPGVEPFDYKRFNDPKWRFVVVATDVNTGKTRYFEKSEAGLSIPECIKASASMPYVSSPVPVGDSIYLDGGCSCNIPYKWAIDQGYEKIVVIKTRDASYRCRPMSQNQQKLIDKLYKNYPAFRDELVNMNERYNWECDELHYLNSIGRVFVIAPSKPVNIGRLEPDMEKLGKLYYRGRKDMIKRYDELLEYLKE